MQLSLEKTIVSNKKSISEWYFILRCFFYWGSVLQLIDLIYSVLVTTAFECGIQPNVYDFQSQLGGPTKP